MCKRRDKAPPRYREVYAPPETMTRPCGIKCCKIFLIILNFLFLATGFVILGLGVWMHLADTHAESYMEIFNDDSCNQCSSALEFLRVPYILILVGALVALLSFLGCCGAWAESTCLLCMYSAMLFLILVAEIGAAVLLGIYKSSISKCLECSMQHQVQLSYNKTDLPHIKSDNATDLLTLAWDRMQEGLKCCGARGPRDYYLSNWYNYTKPRIGINVPPTCCGFEKVKEVSMVSRMSCQSEANFLQPPPEDQEPRLLRTTGCHKAFNTWLQTNITIALTVLIAVIVLQVLDFIASCLLLSRIRSEQSRPEYMPAGYYPPKI